MRRKRYLIRLFFTHVIEVLFALWVIVGAIQVIIWLLGALILDVLFENVKPPYYGEMFIRNKYTNVIDV